MYNSVTSAPKAAFVNKNSNWLRRLGVCLTAALLFLSSTVFVAGQYTIDATGVDWNRGENIWIRENGTDVQTYFTGVIYITLTGPNGPLPL